MIATAEPAGTLQIILQAGALGLLALLLVGLFILLKLGVPVAKDFLIGLVGALTEQGKTLVASRSETAAGFTATHARIDLVETKMGAKLSESHALLERRIADESNRLEGVIRERSSNVSDDLAETAKAAVDSAVARVQSGDFQPHTDVERSPLLTPARGFAPVRRELPTQPSRRGDQ
jgi:hypothetical protein